MKLFTIYIKKKNISKTITEKIVKTIQKRNNIKIQQTFHGTTH